MRTVDPAQEGTPNPLLKREEYRGCMKLVVTEGDRSLIVDR